MKKLIFLVTILIAINANAITRSEMIKSDLLKLGISKEIINKTIELDKEVQDIPNISVIIYRKIVCRMLLCEIF